MCWVGVSSAGVLFWRLTRIVVWVVSLVLVICGYCVLGFVVGMAVVFGLWWLIGIADGFVNVVFVCLLW